MSTELLVTVTSDVVLGLLALLFRAEEARGSRLFLGTVRSYLDRVVIFCSLQLSRITQYVNIHIVRVSFHYIVHSVLGFMIALLHRVQNRLSHLQTRNRHRVKAVKKSRTIESHLDKLTSFKEESALSEAEKSRRREQ